MFEDGRCDLCRCYPPCDCGQYGDDAKPEELDLPKYCKDCHSKQKVVDSSLRMICQLREVVLTLVNLHKNQSEESWNESLKKAEEILNKKI